MTAGDINSYQLLKLSKKVSEADVTVFINGPTGTGKEVLSRFIHKNSKRSDKPFVGINCAAIPENMLEAILFGHEKGAFTGASTSNKGIFRAADGGTLLLDEISEMPLSLQAKLLRVLQEKIVTPLGSQQEIPVDVRVIATTNRSMTEEIKQNRFREDLYYRLNVFPLLTKPLCERKDDIIPIATNLLIRHISEICEIPYIEHKAIKSLLEYKWPGNVRELENVMQRALVLCSNSKISELDIIVDSETNKVSVQENLREQILSKASLEEGVSNV
jgi:two-component system response regulator FlrC